VLYNSNRKIEADLDTCFIISYFSYNFFGIKMFKWIRNFGIHSNMSLKKNSNKSVLGMPFLVF
jgi:hypothetical protein